MPKVLNTGIKQAGESNVTEWFKKKDCWAYIQMLNLPFEPGFEDELAEGQALPTVGRGKKKAANKKPVVLTPEDRDRQAKVVKHSAAEWIEIIAWARKSGRFEDKQISIASTLAGYASNGWLDIPSPYQTAPVVELIDGWNTEKVGVYDE